MSQRRNISVFNMSFLDLITNYLGATTILLLVAMKHYQETPCPNISRKIEAHYDPKTQRIWSDSLSSAVQEVKSRDTILVIVRDEQPLPCGPKQSGRRDDGDGKRERQSDVCAIFPKIENAQCDLKAGTYTAQLVVEKSGGCYGESWKSADGITGRYGQPVTVGPFPLRESSHEIVVTDARNSASSQSVRVFAPNCGAPIVGPSTPDPPKPGGSDRPAPPPPPSPVAPTLPGDINFYISWGDKNEKVDLYVQRDNRWVYDEHRNEPSIGRWDNMKAGVFDRTDCETVRQDKPLPGTYKVFAHYKGHRDGTDKATLKVSLWAISKTKPGGNKKLEFAVPLTRQSPKRGGGKLLATVEIAADGSIRVR